MDKKLEFTYKSYQELIELLKKNNYNVCDYYNYKKYDKCVILRHDVDLSLEKALEMAKFENSLGVYSTYYILLSTNFYNIFSKKYKEIIYNIIKLGHKIGLHFDVRNYDINNEIELEKYIRYEIEIMEKALEMKIDNVAFHRTLKWCLEGNFHFEGIINSYSYEFFKDFKYVSDSRMNWREPVIDIIESNEYDKLHVLTHAFGFGNSNQSFHDVLLEFCQNSRLLTYDSLSDNMTELEKTLEKSEV